MSEAILYRELVDSRECVGLLTSFERYQETTRVLRRQGDQYVWLGDHFIDAWDADKKADVESELAGYLANGGAICAAFDGEVLAGFASIDGQLFGSQLQYIELMYMHVSQSYRHRGIGRELFAMCCRCAKRRDVQKLYISAHPAFETQQFYRAMGCVLATEVNELIYKKEPFDIQLEYILQANRLFRDCCKED